MKQRDLRVCMRWITEMSAGDKWGLTEQEVRILLGGVGVGAYQEMKSNTENGDPVFMTPDTLERRRVLLGIWTGLQQLFVPGNQKELAYSWFSKLNNVEFLRGMSIKDYLLEEKSLRALYRVRNYLYAQTGTW